MQNSEPMPVTFSNQTQSACKYVKLHFEYHFTYCTHHTSYLGHQLVNILLCIIPFLWLCLHIPYQTIDYTG